MNVDQEFMEVTAVRRLAGRLSRASRLLRRANKTLYALMLVLQTTAAVGLIGDELVSHYLAQIEPSLESLARRCATTGDELRRSADAYETGEPAGSTRFY